MHLIVGTHDHDDQDERVWDISIQGILIITHVV